MSVLGLVTLYKVIENSAVWVVPCLIPAPHVSLRRVYNHAISQQTPLNIKDKHANDVLTISKFMQIKDYRAAAAATLDGPTNICRKSAMLRAGISQHPSSPNILYALTCHNVPCTCRFERFSFHIFTHASSDGGTNDRHIL